MEQLILQSEDPDSPTMRQREQEMKPEGFEQEEHLSPARKRNSIAIKEAIDTFYKIPQAKPLLSKAFVDYSKPKVLIKEVPMYKEPEELISYRIMSFSQETPSLIEKQQTSRLISKNLQHSPSHTNSEILLSSQPQQFQSPHNLKQTPFKSIQKPQQSAIDSNPSCSLWQKYIIKSGYHCVYMKYLRESMREQVMLQTSNDETQRKELRKKLRLQLLKICHNSQNLFNTYFIDLDFITQAGTTLIRNLIDCKLDQVYAKWQQSAQHQTHPNIQFDSRFECGNLFMAFSKIDRRTLRPVEPRVFDLILQNDINTKGYTGWFYFSVRSKCKGRLKFNVVNMHKPHSFYSSGMKVLVFSYQKFINDKIEWHRDGYNYTYRKNQILKHSDDPTQRYYTLSFTLDQKYDNDMLYIAASIPYSYSRLVKFIDGVEKVARLNSNIYLKKETHINSISSNCAPVLTLTWKRDKKDKSTMQKKIIAIIARQHPSQTASSFVMQGLVNSLVYMSTQHSVELLKKYIFKIIPMFNVDGVIYGNSRCDISGSDVNRKWTKSPNAFLYPVNSSAKKLYQQLVNEGYDVDYFIDLHGHSKKLGTFVYSCKLGEEVETRVFSWVMSKVCNKFVLDNCIFGLASSKRETARGAMIQMVNGRKSITLETSFYGWRRQYGTNGNNNGVVKHFDVKDLHQIGENLLTTIYTDHSRDPKLYNWANLKSQIRAYLDSSQQLLHGDEQVQEESGSDSSPDVDEMNFEEKTSCFLPPTVVTKIGLAQVKIVERTKGKQKIQNTLKKGTRHPDPNFQDFNGFQNHHEQENNNDDIHLKSFFSNNFQRNNTLEPKLLRQTKSVTKISPFKFTQRNRKSFSTKKIRIAIDVKYVQEMKKVSIPSLLPQIEQKKDKVKKKNFWNNFNKQYESLVKERENLFAKKLKDVAEGSTYRGSKHQ